MSEKMVLRSWAREAVEEWEIAMSNGATRAQGFNVVAEVFGQFQEAMALTATIANPSAPTPPEEKSE